MVLLLPAYIVPFAIITMRCPYTFAAQELREYGFQCECPRCSSGAEASTVGLQRDDRGKRPANMDEEGDDSPELRAGASGSGNNCKRARPE